MDIYTEWGHVEYDTITRVYDVNIQYTQRLLSSLRLTCIALH